jgi:hypothetical protein
VIEILPKLGRHVTLWKAANHSISSLAREELIGRARRSDNPAHIDGMPDTDSLK